MSDNATILIKKADGTTERISLAEFHARQKRTEPVKIEKKLEPVKPVVHAKPVVMPPLVELKENKSVSEIKKNNFTKSDVASLLEEPLIGEGDNVPLVSRSRISQADEIIYKLSFKAPDQARLRGLIQLRLKDVRGEDETRGWLTRSVDEGGAGLKLAEAEEVLKLCRGESVNESDLEKVKPLKKDSFNSKAGISRTGLSVGQAGSSVLKVADTDKKIPAAYHEMPVPAVMPGKKQFFNPPAFKEIKGLKDLKQTETQNNVREYSNNTSARQIVRDILPAKKISVGPADEIRAISLVDFRRLSVNPAEAATRLKQKFINLRDESYLLFLEALAAWRMSPLYQDYIGSVTQALNQNARLNGLLADKNKIQMAEISEIIKMENGL